MKESRTITLGKREIGDGHKPFIVAEAGINHNGELKKALEMVVVAKQAGADAIKFQTFKADEMVGEPTQMFSYTSQGKTVTESMLEMFRRYELKPSDWAAIRTRCDAEGIVFFSTPQNPSDLEIVMQVGVPAIKVGSDDFVNLPLLQRYAKTKLPIILSCGMSNMGEVHEALEAVGAFSGYPVALLVCTSQYPTPPQDVNILRVKTLRDAYPFLPIGFSDHTQDSIAAAMAVALGACLFEKHFTLDRNLPGPDHWFSEDPDSLKEYVHTIRTAYTMRGDGVVRPHSAAELENKKEFRRFIVAARDIKESQLFAEGDFVMRRIKNGSGLPPKFVPILLGKQARRDFHIGEVIEI